MADLVPSIMRGDPSKSPRGPRPPMVEALIALEEAFRCPICQDLYREPKMYPCTHSACRDCANQAIAFKQECPVCKYNENVNKRALMDNENVTEIVNAFREVAEAFNLPKEDDITEAQLAASKPITAEERRAQLQQSREEGDHDGLRNGSDATVDPTLFTKPSSSSSSKAKAKAKARTGPSSSVAIGNGRRRGRSRSPPMSDRSVDKMDSEKNSSSHDSSDIRAMRSTRTASSVTFSSSSSALYERQFGASMSSTRGVHTAAQDNLATQRDVLMPWGVGDFHAGDQVEVKGRHGPGINKAGGVAWVKSVNVEKRTATVKLIIAGSTYRDLSFEFLRPVESSGPEYCGGLGLLGESRSRKRRSRSSDSNSGEEDHCRPRSRANDKLEKREDKCSASHLSWKRRSQKSVAMDIDDGQSQLDSESTALLDDEIEGSVKDEDNDVREQSKEDTTNKVEVFDTVSKEDNISMEVAPTTAESPAQSANQTISLEEEETEMQEYPKRKRISRADLSEPVAELKPTDKCEEIRNDFDHGIGGGAVSSQNTGISCMPRRSSRRGTSGCDNDVTMSSSNAGAVINSCNKDEDKSCNDVNEDTRNTLNNSNDCDTSDEVNENCAEDETHSFAAEEEALPSSSVSMCSARRTTRRRATYEDPESNIYDSNRTVKEDHADDDDEEEEEKEDVEAEEDAQQQVQQRFKIGDSVQVVARTGPGENKPGGVAKVHDFTMESVCGKGLEGSGFYVVKYVLGGTETVAARYVQAINSGVLDLPRRSRAIRQPEEFAADSALMEVLKRSLQDYNMATQSRQQNRPCEKNSATKRRSGGSEASSSATQRCKVSSKSKKKSPSQIVQKPPSISPTNDLSATMNLSSSTEYSEDYGSRNSSKIGSENRVTAAEESASEDSESASESDGEEIDELDTTRGIVVAFSGYDDKEKKKFMQKFQQLGVKVHDGKEWKEDVTHVVVKVLDAQQKIALGTGIITTTSMKVGDKRLSSVDPSRVAEKRTLKYMRGILEGLWMVSTAWAERCFVEKDIVDEAAFEIIADNKATTRVLEAPRRAREASKMVASAGKVTVAKCKKRVSDAKDKEELSSNETTTIDVVSNNYRSRQHHFRRAKEVVVAQKNPRGRSMTLFRSSTGSMAANTTSPIRFFVLREKDGHGISTIMSSDLESELSTLVTAGGGKFQVVDGSLDEAILDAFREINELKTSEASDMRQLNLLSSSAASSRASGRNSKRTGGMSDIVERLAVPHVVVLFDPKKKSIEELQTLQTEFESSIRRISSERSIRGFHSICSNVGSSGSEKENVFENGDVELLSFRWCLDSISNFEPVACDGYRIRDEIESAEVQQKTKKDKMSAKKRKKKC